MIRQTVVLLAVALERLTAPTGKRTDDLLAAAVRPFIAPFEQKKLLAVAYALRIGHRKRRLAHRQIMNRIDEIGLARSVVPHKAIDTRGQRKLLLTDILEIDERQSFEIHTCYLPAEPAPHAAAGSGFAGTGRSLPSKVRKIEKNTSIRVDIGQKNVFLCFELQKNKN